MTMQKLLDKKQLGIDIKGLTVSAQFPDRNRPLSPIFQKDCYTQTE